METEKQWGVQVQFRLRDGDEPPGQISLARLERFASGLRAAALKTVQSSLGMPAFRTGLPEGERRPEYRLVDLRDGSTTLVLEPLSGETEDVAISRHVNALETYRAAGVWPVDSQSAERKAWAAAYQALLRGQPGARVEVALDDRPTLIVDADVVGSLDREEELPQLQEAEVVGNLHLIDWEERPRFKIRTPDADLAFELTEELKPVVDELRWKTVRATAYWEVGTNRARLIDGPRETDESPGVELRTIIGAPPWITEQLKRLDTFAQSRHGWDGGRARPPLRSRVNGAMQLLRDVHRLFPGSISGGGAVFGLFEDGAVEVEWTVGGRFLNAEPTGRVWVVLCTDDNRVVFEGQVDYRGLLNWVGWLLGMEAPSGE